MSKSDTVKQVLLRAELFCTHHKERLTKPRLEVLRIIASSEKSLGAYEILEELSHTMKSPKPPTAYRAIEFWQKTGFIHRIESQSSYVLCQADHLHQGGQFMVCESCGSIIETHVCKLPDTLKKKVDENGFIASSWHIEIHGVCQKCQ